MAFGALASKLSTQPIHFFVAFQSHITKILSNYLEKEQSKVLNLFVVFIVLVVALCKVFSILCWREIRSI